MEHADQARLRPDRVDIVLKIYSGIISTIDSLPLISGLLELTGLIWLLNFLLHP